MKEQILLFRFEDEDRLGAVRKAMLPLHIACRVVPEEKWSCPLGVLAGLEPSEALPEMESAALTAEVLVLCGLSDAGIQSVVAALRKAGVYIPYKAALTPTNQDWTAGQLFGELVREHEMMQQMLRERRAAEQRNP